MSQSYSLDSTKKSVANNDVIPNHQLPGQRPFVVKKPPQSIEPSTPLQRERMARLDAGVMRTLNLQATGAIGEEAVRAEPTTHRSKVEPGRGQPRVQRKMIVAGEDHEAEKQTIQEGKKGAGKKLRDFEQAEATAHGHTYWKENEAVIPNGVQGAEERHLAYASAKGDPPPVLLLEFLIDLARSINNANKGWSALQKWMKSDESKREKAYPPAARQALYVTTRYFAAAKTLEAWNKEIEDTSEVTKTIENSAKKEKKELYRMTQEEVAKMAKALKEVYLPICDVWSEAQKQVDEGPTDGANELKIVGKVVPTMMPTMRLMKSLFPVLMQWQTGEVSIESDKTREKRSTGMHDMAKKLGEAERDALWKVGNRHVTEDIKDKYKKERDHYELYEQADFQAKLADGTLWSD